MPGRDRQSWWDIPLTLVVAGAVLWVLTAFLAKPFAIPSGSMEPTLRAGDRVLVDRLAYRLGPIERGDVVVFDGTDSFTPADAPADYVKRVVGVGGDRVRCCAADGRLSVNGDLLDEQGYLAVGDLPSDVAFDVQVPAGRLFVLGDHRSQSADSRSHLGDPGGGMVSEDRVVGRVSHVLWPWGRIGAVARPDTFAALQEGPR